MKLAQELGRSIFIGGIWMVWAASVDRVAQESHVTKA